MDEKRIELAKAIIEKAEKSYLFWQDMYEHSTSHIDKQIMLNKLVKLDAYEVMFSCLMGTEEEYIKIMENYG